MHTVNIRSSKWDKNEAINNSTMRNTVRDEGDDRITEIGRARVLLQHPEGREPEPGYSGDPPVTRENRIE